MTRMTSDHMLPDDSKLSTCTPKQNRRRMRRTLLAKTFTMSMALTGSKKYIYNIFTSNIKCNENDMIHVYQIYYLMTTCLKPQDKSTIYL